MPTVAMTSNGCIGTRRCRRYCESVTYASGTSGQVLTSIGVAAIAFFLLSALSSVVTASSSDVDGKDEQITLSEGQFKNDGKEQGDNRVIVVLQALGQNTERTNGDDAYKRLPSIGNDITANQSTSLTDSSDAIRDVANDAGDLRSQRSSAAAESRESFQSYSRQNQRAGARFSVSSDCHQLDIEQATASILDRSRRRRLQRQIDESATGDGDDDANEDRQLFDELRRRFNSNRTFVLCKPMRSPSAENRSPGTKYSKITGDTV